MNFEPTFRIHLAQPHGLVDTPVIISTTYANAAGHAEAEWFLVIPEDKGILFAQRNKLDLQSFPDEHVIFDEELFLNEALDQAILRLRRYIENKESSTPLLLSTQTTVQPCDHNHLVKLWMRGAYCGCLSEIRAKSGCSALIDTLVWIHGLPMLATGDV